MVIYFYGYLFLWLFVCLFLFVCVLLCFLSLCLCGLNELNERTKRTNARLLACLLDWLTDWLVGWLINWLIGWMREWVSEWMNEWYLSLFGGTVDEWKIDVPVINYEKQCNSNLKERLTPYSDTTKQTGSCRVTCSCLQTLWPIAIDLAYIQQRSNNFGHSI